MAEIASGWGAHSAPQPGATPSAPASDDPEFLGEVALSINRHTLAYMADRNRRDGEPFAAECITASAVACKVFPQLGVHDVEPVALELFALSRTAYEKVLEGKEIAGAWGRSASADSEVAGHVGVMVSGALVDATAGQMAFPSAGLYAPAVAVISRESMESRQEDQFVTLACDGGDTYLLYKPVTGPSAPPFRATEGWLDRATINAISERVMKEFNNSAGSQSPDSRIDLVTTAKVTNTHPVVMGGLKFMYPKAFGSSESSGSQPKR